MRDAIDDHVKNPLLSGKIGSARLRVDFKAGDSVKVSQSISKMDHFQ